MHLLTYGQNGQQKHQENGQSATAATLDTQRHTGNITMLYPTEFILKENKYHLSPPSQALNIKVKRTRAQHPWVTQG